MLIDIRDAGVTTQTGFRTGVFSPTRVNCFIRRPGDTTPE